MRLPDPHRPLVPAIVLLAAASLALTACSSSARPNATRAHSRPPQALCQELNGILSDGPDPGADPVGYALSQILPLQGVDTSDTAVGATVARLVAADQALVRSNGSDRAAAGTIRSSDHALDTACPGVAP